MIYFSDNFVTFTEDSAAEDYISSEGREAEDSTSSKGPEAKDSTSSEGPEAEDSPSSEDYVVKDSSFDVQHSANGESQQSVVPTVVNDVVVPDNSYSKYCFFFLLLLFALFVGRSFRKGV